MNLTTVGRYSGVENMRRDLRECWGETALARYDALLASPNYYTGKARTVAERITRPVLMGKNQHTIKFNHRLQEALKHFPNGNEWNVPKLYREMKKIGFVWNQVNGEWEKI